MTLTALEVLDQIQQFLEVQIISASDGRKISADRTDLYYYDGVLNGLHRANEILQSLRVKVLQENVLTDSDERTIAIQQDADGDWSITKADKTIWISLDLLFNINRHLVSLKNNRLTFSARNAAVEYEIVDWQQSSGKFLAERKAYEFR